MTTLEELLTMMAEDAARTVKPEKRPPPIPPKKADAIGKDEIESLDDGPVLTSDRLWPAALPRPARRGPPPPPPGRRARGTEPLCENVTSGLIDVRAMAMAYERARADAAPAEPAPVDDVIKVEVPVAPLPAPEPEAAPRPIMAEGTRPMPVVEEPAAAEPDAEPAEESDRRAGLWLVVAQRAAMAVAIGGVAALAVTLLFNRVRSDGAASDPTDDIAELAPAEAAAVAAMAPAEAAPVAAMAPADVAPEPIAEPAIEPVAEPAIQPVVIIQPTTITEVSGAATAEPTPARADEPAERPGPGEPPPELLADGCFDAACAVTAPRARRAAPRPAEVVTVPARLATRPSNSEIASAIFAAQDQIDGCGDVYGTSGPVPIKIKIAASGAITSVAVAQGTTRFRTCVSDIVRRLRMPASLIGTTASFPVLIR